MLVEVAVRDLGVIAEAVLSLGPGMTALTGETGAGKTLVVEALELLGGGRADPVLVRPGAAEALVEGRFDVGGEEVVLARAVPASGRSRAWVDARMAPVAALAEAGARLVELHGQHAHQALLTPGAQRAALDAFGGVDRGPREAARTSIGRVVEDLAALGGDSRARAREVDLLRFQLEELDRAGLDDPGEDEALASLEERLAGAAAHREAARCAVAALSGDGSGAGDRDDGAAEALGAALAALAGHAPLAGIEQRLRGVEAELSDLASEARRLVETLEED
ncbi:MAG: DNA repair protein RecN, partial [Acidimicrobiales bacterium]